MIIGYAEGVGTPADLSFSYFLRNLIANGTVTSEQASLLASLSTPHQQFAAITTFRSTGGRSLESIIEETRQGQAAPVSRPRNIRAPIWATGATALAGIGLCLVMWSTHGLLIQNRRGLPVPVSGFEVHPPAPTTPAIGEALINHPVHSARPSKPALAAAKQSQRLVRAPSAMPHNTPTLVPSVRASATPVLPAPDTSALAPLPSAAGSVPAPSVPSITLSAATMPPQILERHLVAKLSAHGFLHLTWDAGDAPQQYALYYAPTPEMKEAKPVTETSIPVNWYDWMPAENQNSVWMAVQGLLANGVRTPLSRPIQVKLPRSSASH